MNRQKIFVIVTAIIAVTGISLLLILGNNVAVPNSSRPSTAQDNVLAMKKWTNPQYDSPPFPKNASSPNYAVLCINKDNVKEEYTDKGKFVTCRPGFYTVPIDQIPKKK